LKKKQLKALKLNKKLKSYLNFLDESIEILKKLREKYQIIYTLPIKTNYLSDTFEEKIDFDSIAYRFSKIQSTLGEKVFKETLEEIGYNTQDKNFLEILNLLVKNNILDDEDIKKWKNLRKIRNELNHTYPDEKEEIVDAINEIFETIDFFEKIVTNIKRLLSS